MNRKLKWHSSVAALALFFLIHSCSNDFLSEYEESVLFATPSESEIDSIFSDWGKRDLNPTDYSVVTENELLNGKYKLKIVSYRVAGIKEYGALLIPETDSLVPVRMFIGGFELNNSVNAITLASDTAATNSSFILAIPALRGQSLEITFNGTLYSSPLSEGDQCDAFDGATDDAIGFLNVIQQTESNADVNRTSVRGGSRGGTVALLAGIRDTRIKRVVDVAGPTDLLELSSLNENDKTYQCQFLDDLKNDQSTLDETRKKIIASSPLFFAEHLPLTQLHMGLNDEIVPVNQGYQLEQKITQLGMSSTFQLYTYDRSHTDIASNNAELEERIEEFLSQL